MFCKISAMVHEGFLVHALAETRVRTVDFYNISDDRWSVSQLSEPRNLLSAASVGNFAIFAGGYTGRIMTDVVDLYNHVTNSWTTARLSVGRHKLAAASVGNYAIFAGGQNTFRTRWDLDAVDLYNSATGIWTTAVLSASRYQLVAASSGDYAIFAGGLRGSCESF
jgi:hypothetical protein